MDLLLPPITPVSFSAVISLAWVGAFLILGMFLRSAFPLFRKYLVPSCVIGGAMGLLVQNSGVLNSLGIGMDVEFLQEFVFHLFCLTWVFMGLRKPDPSEAQKTAKASTKRIAWYYGVTASVGGIACLVGMTSSWVLHHMGVYTGPETSGVLIPYAFITGPGQALTIAAIWEGASEFVGLTDLALASGATGFAVAIIVGVFLINIIARKKKLDIVNCPSAEEECGYYGECTEKQSAGEQTTSVTSIDVLAWHIAIGLLTYLGIFLIAVVCYVLLPPAAKVIIWAFFFLMCSLFAILVRNIMVKMNLGHLLCNAMNTRLSNTIVDFMIAGTFISIQLGNVMQYLTVYVVCTVLGALSVAVVTWWVFSKLKEDGVEGFAFVFGCLSGTISTAFILLRLVDPEMKSPVPVHYALSNSLGLIFGVATMPVMHLEVLYGYPGWYVIAGSVGTFLIGAVIYFLCRQPQNEVAWQPEK